MPNLIRYALPSLVMLLAACNFVESEVFPTAVSTRAPSGPTVQASAVFRGELPTEAPNLIVGQNDPTAAAAPSGGDLPPLLVGTSQPGEVKQAIQITASDGAALLGDLYSTGTERVPGILMLAPDSSAWLDLPLRLQAAGFTVMAMNVRDAANLSDFSVMLRSLSDAGTVDPGRIAVIGAEVGADFALAGCAADLLCDAVAIISPTQNNLLPAMQAFNPRAIFLAAGQDDTGSYPVVTALKVAAQGEAVLETGSGVQRGAFLLQANPNMGDRMIEWLRGQF
jgi:hypothetical protein